MRCLVIDAPGDIDADPRWIYDGSDGSVVETDGDVFAMIGRREIDTIAGRPVGLVWEKAAELAMLHDLTRMQAIALAIDVIPGQPAYGHFGRFDSVYYNPRNLAREKAMEEAVDGIETFIAEGVIDDVAGVPARRIRDMAAAWIMECDMTRKQAVYLAIDTLCDGPAHVIIGTTRSNFNSALSNAYRKMLRGSRPG